MKKNSKKNSSIANLYKLDGTVPFFKALPFGIQHILAMFLANVMPMIIITGNAVYAGTKTKLTELEISQLLLCTMFAAGIATLIQLYPILGKIGSGLPVVMGCSFTFLATAINISSNSKFGYETMLGAVIVGGCFEGILGLTAKYWRKIITPIISACVVTGIGFSLLLPSMQNFGGGVGKEFGAWYNMFVAFITFCTCIIAKKTLPGLLKNLNLLLGLIVGYFLSLVFTVTGTANMISFKDMIGTVNKLGFINYPHPCFILGHMPKFNIGAIISFSLVFLVSAAETIGDTSAICSGGLRRNITEKEIAGSLCVDGFGSALSGIFGCSPITSFSQNVGIVVTTKIVNRMTIGIGAGIIVICSFFPPIGALFASVPTCVLGGCTVMMFGSILYTGMEMIARAKFKERNMMIVAISFSIGIGSTLVGPEFFRVFPKVIGEIFYSNCIAGIFVCALVLDRVLPGKNNKEDIVTQKLKEDEA